MNTNDLINAVMQLDLEPIKMKLMHEASGEGWSLEKANAVEKEYRRFLCLMKMYPDEDTAPLDDVDTFWHYHILDTMKYAADCEQAFGYFLHHYPYVGMRGEDDEQFRQDSGNRMRELYEATFGEAYPGSIVTAMDGAAAWCASPHVEMGKRTDGTANDTAWCASPHVNAASSATAWCASPHIDKLTKRNIDTAGSATAWCASPHIDKLTKRNIDTAGSSTAWCASPHIDKLTKRNVDTAGSATAWCASPHIDKLTKRNVDAAGSATAWCASPHIDKLTKRNVDAAGSATAWCASPHIDKLTKRNEAIASKVAA